MWAWRAATRGGTGGTAGRPHDPQRRPPPQAQTLPGREGRAKVHRRQRRVCVSKITAGQPGAGAGGQEPRFPLLAETAHQADMRRQPRAAGQTAQGAASTAKTTVPQPRKPQRKADRPRPFARHWKGALIVGGVGLMLLLVMVAHLDRHVWQRRTGPCRHLLSLRGQRVRREPKPPMPRWKQTCRHELDNYESLHPGYDEYRFDLDEIKHDPERRHFHPLRARITACSLWGRYR